MIDLVIIGAVFKCGIEPCLQTQSAFPKSQENQYAAASTQYHDIYNGTA